MAASKNKKIVRQGNPKGPHVVQSKNPKGRHVAQSENPSEYYKKHPSWIFSTCDTEMWPFTEKNIGHHIWDEILPHLQEFETQTWGEILVVAKKQNHPIDAETLNPIAQKRLAEKHIEQQSIISLRLSSTHRLYGYIVGSVFNILWYDHDHGDNDTCVCRSHKKGT